MISEVLVKDGWCITLDADGQKIGEMPQMFLGKLLGFGSDFVLFLQDNNYRIYDKNFKKINEKAKTKLGEFKTVKEATLSFSDGKWIRTYDRNFRKIGEHLIG